MNIGIIGLGLIGGSLAGAFKASTDHKVLGMDRNPSVILKAKLADAIDAELTEENLKDCDVVLLALYPKATIDFVTKHAADFKRGCVVCDCCGIKREVCAALFPLAKANGFIYAGGHPMAGRECWGFDSAKSGLFKGASFILVPEQKAEMETLQFFQDLLTSIGFTRLQISTPEEHDRIIACTSQLAHVVSSAYVKSPTASEFRGFSAGSFRDMTRVAKLNAPMWTELFFENDDYLIEEIDGLIDRLAEYRDALKNHDEQQMEALLEQGNQVKLSLS